LYLSQRFFPDRMHYSPIASAGLEKYRFFEKLGFFGINPNTRAGAARFLTIGEQVLQQPNGALWVTVQEHFSDVRERPVRVEAGAGHLARRARNTVMLPVALEYAFWNERYPEAFACMGEPIPIDDGSLRSARQWSEEFSRALERTQAALSQAVIARDAAKFEPLLAGTAGIGGVYDLWRALKARLHGRRFQPEHGSI
jgi:1-acyl-sn-glycerol-3-phosphate acyltransferase